MKFLFTADLHLNIHASNPRSGHSAMDDFAEAIRRERPNAVVVAGDMPARHPMPQCRRGLRAVSRSGLQNWKQNHPMGR